MTRSFSLSTFSSLSLSPVYHSSIKCESVSLSSRLKVSFVHQHRNRWLETNKLQWCSVQLTSICHASDIRLRADAEMRMVDLVLSGRLLATVTIWWIVYIDSFNLMRKGSLCQPSKSKGFDSLYPNIHSTHPLSTSSGSYRAVCREWKMLHHMIRNTVSVVISWWYFTEPRDRGERIARDLAEK